MSHRKKSWRLLPLARALGVLSAVGIITTLVTFAAIQSTGNALTGNTIETATAALQISKDGTNFSDSMGGYDFNGLIPGGAAVPGGTGYLVALKNTGSTKLALSLSVPVSPTVVGITDLSTVNVLLTPFISGSGTFPAQSMKLSDLIAGKIALANATVNPGSKATFYLQISMDANAVNGSGATVTGLDLSFSGLPQ